jgi:hypothetical protein
MIEDIRDDDEPDFLRHWAERAWDDLQLAHIAAMEKAIVNYAMTAWRPAGRIQPPMDTLLLCACEEGLVLMVQNQHHEWRTSAGQPHKPPRAWMPCPAPPNGRGR